VNVSYAITETCSRSHIGHNKFVFEPIASLLYFESNLFPHRSFHVRWICLKERRGWGGGGEVGYKGCVSRWGQIDHRIGVAIEDVSVSNSEIVINLD